MEPEVVMYTDLPGAVSRRQGKVRDIYDYGEVLLIVTTDRVSAFDCVMPNGIPGKGKVLNGMSMGWFDATSHLVPNHVVATDPRFFPEAVQPYAEMLTGRAMLVEKAEVLPVECVVRGYLAGSGWAAYQRTNGTVFGHHFGEPLVESSKLPEPIFTPSTKAETGHDENVTFSYVANLLGQEMAQALKDRSLALYNFASERLILNQLILADTKYEFGLGVQGDLIVIDEMMTPDSSRYWDANKYQPGRPQEAIDKQYVRDYLETLGWDKQPPAPQLPEEVVRQTAEIYQTAFHRVSMALQN